MGTMETTDRDVSYAASLERTDEGGNTLSKVQRTPS
jgi:hypothetical protein